MATKEELKEKFKTGKKPTGDDFAALIDGVKGEPGSPGKDGADGFGTKAQYDDIIARLSDLEVGGS
ncbi:hypothetical protein [Lederbergia lenta]|uniref:hypothetical protein n=1 Tax=Lederbergia lenta TaxID=1467 RepID=UPI002041454E|nr:hypothetical protein [Lederbergia lenta]MCM3110038.1 hypothetical protein [Lederbergia lenta]